MPLERAGIARNDDFNQKTPVRDTSRSLWSGRSKAVVTTKLPRENGTKLGQRVTRSNRKLLEFFPNRLPRALGCCVLFQDDYNVKATSNFGLESYETFQFQFLKSLSQNQSSCTVGFPGLEAWPRWL